MKTVFIQNWDERERGSMPKPDGFTVHISVEQLKAYVSWYNKTFNNLDYVPDEYTCISGDPIEVEVDDSLYELIYKATKQNLASGDPINHVRGKMFNGHFSTTPKRDLKAKDIILR